MYSFKHLGCSASMIECTFIKKNNFILTKYSDSNPPTQWRSRINRKNPIRWLGGGTYSHLIMSCN
ncbi:hypothetical protein DPEC_G00274020 [Dallia pectoralis]|uniref:Uncharacterized protein n=1 Tax=Dallia pectoralis TaxID=75939 RepID=A0ACC2FQ87_DALPE|nr:hypothetical protein DPEC_G00274020 [Dallia pectoralis]